MLIKEYLDAFSQFTGEPRTSLETYDRRLSDAGMRKKAVGRSYPHVTADEAINLLVATMSGVKSEDAPQEARQLLDANSKYFPNYLQTEFGSNVCGRSLREDLKAICRYFGDMDFTQWGGGNKFFSLTITDGLYATLRYAPTETNAHVAHYFSQSDRGKRTALIYRKSEVHHHVLGWIGAMTRDSEDA